MIILLLGGARSGKSLLAENAASRFPKPIVYVAPAVVEDEDFARRVRVHRERRPADWDTAEPGAGLVGCVLSAPKATLLIDSLGSWVAATADFAVDAAGLCDALRRHDGDVVIVSEEVGLGVHPSSEVGGRFRDALGTLNSQVAAVADKVYLVVAGRTVELEVPRGLLAPSESSGRS
ncbi:MAG: bifunctional adenosylcobinamide kinase/adenosylcobinamide-phosphate guanylyltransferase [Acidimicrobiales bacterium]